MLQSLTGTSTSAFLVRYLLIGGFVFFVDVGSFMGLLRLRLPLYAVTTGSYALAVATHFFANKYFNFRDESRSTLLQMRTYVIVVFGAWLITLAVVSAFARAGFAPVIGKFVAIAINFPYGFLAHRYLTFGGGIARALRKWSSSAAPGKLE